MEDNITKPYKKSNVNLINNAIKESKAIAAEVKLDDRIEQFNQRKVLSFLNTAKSISKSVLKVGLLTLPNWKQE